MSFLDYLLQNALTRAGQQPQQPPPAAALPGFARTAFGAQPAPRPQPAAPGMDAAVLRAAIATAMARRQQAPPARQPIPVAGLPVPNVARAQMAATPGPPSVISGPTPPPNVGLTQPASAQFWDQLSPQDRLAAVQAARAAEQGVPASPYTGPVADVAAAVGQPLAQWVGDVTGAVGQEVSHPSGQNTLNLLGAFVPPPARPVLQKPQQFVATRIGDLVYAAATGQPMPEWVAALPFGPKIYQTIMHDVVPDDAKRQKVIAAHQQGGGLGTFWGAVVDTSDMDPVSRFIANWAAAMLTDPWTYAPVLAAAGKTVEAAGTLSALEKGGPEAASAGDLARIVTGKAIQAPNTAANVVGGLPFELAGQAIGGIRGRIGAVDDALSPSESAQARARSLGVEDLVDEAGKVAPEGTVAAATPPPETRPRAAETAVPPATPEGPREFAVVRMGERDFQVVDPATGTPVLGDTGKPVTFRTYRIAQADALRRTGESVPAGLPTKAAATTSPDAYVPVTPEGILKEHWLNPETGRAHPYEPGGPRLPSLPEFVAHELGRVDRPMAEAWWRDVEGHPDTPPFVAAMGRFDDEAQRVARQDATARGRTPEKVRGEDTVAKALVKVGHTVEVQRAAYRDLTGAEPPPFRYDYGDAVDPVAANPLPGRRGLGVRYEGVADERNLIEHAVFGTEEEAARARQYWHVREAIAKKAKNGTEATRIADLTAETTRLREFDQGRGETAPTVKEGTAPPAPPIGGETTAPVGGKRPVLPSVRGSIPNLPEEIAPIADQTNLGRAFNAGTMGKETYANLNRTIRVGGEPIRVIDLIHREQAAAGGHQADALAAIRSAIAKADGLTPKDRGALLRAIDTGLAAYRENVMFNPATGLRGAIADQAGDMLAMAVTGAPDAAVASLSLRNAARWWRYGRGAARAIEDDPRVNELGRFGVGLPRDVMEVFQRTETAASGEMLVTQGARKLEQKVLGGHRVASRITPALAAKWTRDLRTALDRNRRVSLLTYTFRREVPEARATLVGLARREGGDAAAQAIRALPEEFSPEDVLAATGSEQLARQWRGLVNRMRTRADEQVGRALFTYEQTNLDAKLKYALLFHYWMSRALVLHTRAALENPGLLNAYVRAFDGLKQLGDEEGLPAPLRTYFKFMGDVGGWYSVADPIGALVPYTVFRDIMGGQERGGERKFDVVVRKSGLFLSPLVQVAASLLGQSDAVPDPSGSWAIRGLVKTTLDYARNHGLGTPGITTDPVSYYERKVFEVASSLADKALVPFAQKIGYWNDTANETTQVLDVLKTQMEADYGPMAGWDGAQRNEYLAAQQALPGSAKGNARAEAALAAWSAGREAGKLAGVAIPGGVQTKFGPRDERIALNKEADAARAAGQELTPEQQNADVATGQITAGDATDAALETQQDAYHKLGTERQRALADGWRNIAYGTMDDLGFGYYTIDGHQIVTTELTQMDDAGRKELADRWVANNDGTGELKALREERDAWTKEHPEYADYDGFTAAIGKDPSAFRRDMVRKYPSYAKAVEGAKKRIGNTDPVIVKRELDKWTTSLAGYEAAAGVRGSVYSEPAKDAPDWKEVAANEKILAGGVGGGGSGSGRLDRLVKNLVNYQAAAEAMFAATGLRPDQVSGPYEQQSLRARGIYPDIPNDVRLYLQWVSVQRLGTDTSPQAFDAYLDELASRSAA